MQTAEPSFYFSLLRLMVRWRGGNDARTELNWIEANVVGSAIHLIAFLFFYDLLLAGLPVWGQVVLLLPLALLVWLFWLFVLYVNALLMKFLRAGGLMRGLPENRGQSILVGFITTVFAFQLSRSETFASVIGEGWITAVFLNLAAAAVLAASSRNESNTA